jgi:putative ABC transport system ATP-binding protein
MNSNSLIQFKGVTKEFIAQDGAVTVLRDVNFAVEKNSFTIIYGPSGSGKTTILNMLLGLLPPTKGRVTVAGKDLYTMNQNERAKFRARHYGVVSQTNNWVSSLSVVENVALPLYLQGADQKLAGKRAMESLEKVGLERYAGYRPTLLSTGQQQRISMARATVQTPMLLIADEPTGNLDTLNGDLIMKLITSLKNHQNVTIVLVTHNLDYLTLSDHRLFIKDGVLTEDEGGYQSDKEKKAALLNAVKMPTAAKKSGPQS